MSRADACLQVWNATKDKPFRYLGVTGGDHIVKTYSGRYYAADLVTGKTRLCVGLPPDQWAHPPQVKD